MKCGVRVPCERTVDKHNFLRHGGDFPEVALLKILSNDQNAVAISIEQLLHGSNGFGTHGTVTSTASYKHNSIRDARLAGRSFENTAYVCIGIIRYEDP